MTATVSNDSKGSDISGALSLNVLFGPIIRNLIYGFHFEKVIYTKRENRARYSRE
tara:strand:- start:261 stop:425 length:165 start_codon:yes stop_codon:yes gene_type:complete